MKTALPRLPGALCRDALEEVCDGIVSVDCDGEITGFTSGFLRLTGGEASAAALDALFPVGLRPRDFRTSTQRRVLRECSLATALGERRARVVYTHDSESVLAAITLTDNAVSEGDSALWMNAILDTTDCVIVVLNRRGQVERFNRAAQSLTGYAPDELAGLPFWDVLLFQEDVEIVRAEFGRLIDGEKSVSRFENRWRMKDGDARFFSWSNCVTRGLDGNVEHVVATALDLTSVRLNELALASLSGDFMDAQSAARRNVSRYLHDTVSQYLVVLALTLSKLQREPDQADPFEIAPTLELVDRCCRDLRVISYALAPPVFEDAEPEAVFDWYVNHLRQDAGVDVEFHADAAMKEISADIRKLLLAALQEWAERAIRGRMVGKTQIRLATLASEVRLELSSDQPDNEAVTAVAVSRVIRERVRALGGTLEIEPRQSGVSVVLSIGAA